MNKNITSTMKIFLPVIKLRIFTGNPSVQDSRNFTGDLVFNNERIYVTGSSISNIINYVKYNLDKSFPDNPFYPLLKLYLDTVPQDEIIDLNLTSYNIDSYSNPD